MSLITLFAICIARRDKCLHCQRKSLTVLPPQFTATAESQHFFQNAYLGENVMVYWVLYLTYLLHSTTALEHHPEGYCILFYQHLG